MVCPPVRGDNPQAFTSGLSPVQADKLWYNYICEIFRLKIGVLWQVTFTLSNDCISGPRSEAFGSCSRIPSLWFNDKEMDIHMI